MVSLKQNFAISHDYWREYNLKKDEADDSLSSNLRYIQVYYEDADGNLTLAP